MGFSGYSTKRETGSSAYSDLSGLHFDGHQNQFRCLFQDLALEQFDLNKYFFPSSEPALQFRRSTRDNPHPHFFSFFFLFLLTDCSFNKTKSCSFSFRFHRARF